MAQQDKTTFENTFNDPTTGLFKDNTSKDIGADDARTLVENVTDSFLNLTDGGTIAGPVTIGTTSTVTHVPTNLQSKVEKATATGSNLNAIFHIEQSVATTGGSQGVAGYAKSSNPTGTVVLNIGAVGDIEHSGAGTLQYARCVQAGGIVSGNGTVTEYVGFYAQPVAITGGSGVVTTVYGIYLDTAVAGTGTITNRYGVYQADPAASNFFAGNKLGVFGATPVTQPTTGSGAASFTANAGTAVNDASTFDGYTLKQVVKALRDLGLLA